MSKKKKVRVELRKNREKPPRENDLTRDFKEGDGRTDDTTAPLLEPILKPLYAAYEALKRAREERQPLDLDIPERKILLKGDGTVDRVIVPERQDANKLIEEFMILANVAAAETLEKARVPLVYRVHDEPSIEKINALREFLASLQIPIAKAGALRPGIFNRILAQVKDTEREQLLNDLLSLMACHAAVRAGDRLTPEEIASLLAQRHVQTSAFRATKLSVLDAVSDPRSSP